MTFHPIRRHISQAAAILLAVGALAASAASASAQSSNPLTAPLELPPLSSDVLPTVPGTSELSDADPASAGVHVTDIRHSHDNLYEVDIYSAAMDKVVTNHVLLPGGLGNTAPRPTFYLMPGSYGGKSDTGNWASGTDYEDFFAEKNVQVVTPIGGNGSLFADWKNAGKHVGAAKWLTYYSTELPYVMETQFHGNNHRAIAGLSASGAAALNIAAHNPGRYQAVASLSGFTTTSSLMGRIAALGITAVRGEAVWDMWGWPDDPSWQANDAQSHLDKLQGTKLYFYSGTGWLENPSEYLSNPMQIANGIMEFLVRMSNDSFVAAARAASLDVTYHKASYGTHDWPYYTAGLYDAWETTVGPALSAG